MTVLLLHGFTGSGPGHWQWWIQAELHRAKTPVLFPQLPDPHQPRVDRWLDCLDCALRRAREADPEGDLVVLAHSCGAALWLHHAARAGATARRRPQGHTEGQQSGLRADRVLLVAPPGPSWHHPDVHGFLPIPLDAAGLELVGRYTRLLSGTGDPYCTEQDAAGYAAALGIRHDVIHRGAHLNADSGYGPWPALLQWTSGLVGECEDVAWPRPAGLQDDALKEAR